VALGIHPCAVACLKSGWDKKLEELLKNNPQVMVGEIGLDGQYPNLDAQEKILRHQLNLAWKYNRPAVIHCFRAWERLIHILKTQRNKLPPKIMFHSHHGNPNLIPEFIQKYNTYFSYSSIFVPASHPKIQACLKATPLDRLLVESDCPDLASTPTDIIPLISQMSQLTKHNPSILKKALFQNAKNFVRF
jgi:TatD DNase family protein